MRWEPLPLVSGRLPPGEASFKMGGCGNLPRELTLPQSTISSCLSTASHCFYLTHTASPLLAFPFCLITCFLASVPASSLLSVYMALHSYALSSGRLLLFFHFSAPTPFSFSFQAQLYLGSSTIFLSLSASFILIRFPESLCLHLSLLFASLLPPFLPPPHFLDLRLSVLSGRLSYYCKGLSDYTCSLHPRSRARFVWLVLLPSDLVGGLAREAETKDVFIDTLIFRLYLEASR